MKVAEPCAAGGLPCRSLLCSFVLLPGSSLPVSAWIILTSGLSSIAAASSGGHGLGRPLLDVHLPVRQGGDDVDLAPFGVQARGGPVRQWEPRNSLRSMPQRMMASQISTMKRWSRAACQPGLNIRDSGTPMSSSRGLRARILLSPSLRPSLSPGDAGVVGHHLLDLGHEGERVLPLTRLEVGEWLQQQLLLGVDKAGVDDRTRRVPSRRRRRLGSPARLPKTSRSDSELPPSRLAP